MNKRNKSLKKPFYKASQNTQEQNYKQGTQQPSDEQEINQMVSNFTNQILNVLNSSKSNGGNGKMHINQKDIANDVYTFVNNIFNKNKIKEENKSNNENNTTKPNKETTKTPANKKASKKEKATEKRKIKEAKLDENPVVTKMPKEKVAPIDKISNLVFSDKKYYNNTTIKVETGKHNSKKKITSQFCLKLDDKVKPLINGEEELNSFDKEVHNAIVTLYAAGNEYITPRMIHRTMTGNKKSSMNKKQQKAIINSLNKLMYTKIAIKPSEEECKAYNFDEFVYVDYVIKAENVRVSLNGKITEAYHLLEEPILYKYAALKNQIIRSDMELMKNSVKKSSKNMVLQSYLLKRVLGMKGKSHLNPNISYDTLFAEMNTTASTAGALRKKKFKIRETIKTILDYWKEKGFILDYVESKCGQKINTLSIQF